MGRYEECVYWNATKAQGIECGWSRLPPHCRRRRYAWSIGRVPSRLGRRRGVQGPAWVGSGPHTPVATTARRETGNHESMKPPSPTPAVTPGANPGPRTWHRDTPMSNIGTQHPLAVGPKVPTPHGAQGGTPPSNNGVVAHVGNSERRLGQRCVSPSRRFIERTCVEPKRFTESSTDLRDLRPRGSGGDGVENAVDGDSRIPRHPTSPMSDPAQ